MSRGDPEWYEHFHATSIIATALCCEGNATDDESGAILVRLTLALLWMALVAGGFTFYCVQWSNGTIDWFDPTHWWWVFFLLVFVVPARVSRWHRPPAAEVEAKATRTPVWAWIFVVTCLVPPVLHGLGLLASLVEENRLQVPPGFWPLALVATLCAWGCYQAGRSARNALARWALCVVLALVVWIVCLSTLPWMRS